MPWADTATRILPARRGRAIGNSASRFPLTPPLQQRCYVRAHAGRNATTLHPGLSTVAGLVGTWRGDGRGKYPTIEPFEYTEELTFIDSGKPFLHYVQRTWSPTGAPMHTETGYLRVVGGETVEFVLAQPTGQTELAQGPLVTTSDGFTCVLASEVVNADSAKKVDATERQLTLEGDTLSTRFLMAAVGVPMTQHLRSTLRREAPRL